jgi:hypothetical protein
MTVAPSSYPANPPICVALVVVLLLLLFFKLYQLCKSEEDDPLGFNEAFSVVKRNTGEAIRLGESRLTNVPTGTLFFFRLALWLFIVVTWTKIILASKDGMMWNTYTFWNFNLIHAYFLMGTIQSYQSMQRQKSGAAEGGSHGSGGQSYEQTLLNKAHLVCGAVALSTCLIVTLVVWLVLYPNSIKHDGHKKAAAHYLRYDSIVEHVFNTLFLAADFYLSTIKIVRKLMIFVCLWPCLYSIDFLRVWFTTGEAVYPFLALDRMLSPLLLLLLFSIHAGLCELWVRLSNCKQQNQASESERSGLLEEADMHNTL